MFSLSSSSLGSNDSGSEFVESVTSNDDVLS